MYLIDTLGERLYEGNRRAYVLCFNGEDGAGFFQSLCKMLSAAIINCLTTRARAILSLDTCVCAGG